MVWDPDEQVPDRLAAESLYCAGEQDRFWEMHDWVFFNVDRWLYADDVPSFLAGTAAAEVGLDGAAMETCLRQERYRDLVEAIRTDALARGIDSTPTFLINGERSLVGAYPFPSFQQIIEEELSP